MVLDDVALRRNLGMVLDDLLRTGILEVGCTCNQNTGKSKSEQKYQSQQMNKSKNKIYLASIYLLQSLLAILE